MAAALAKLCDVHELILVARKCSRPTKARTLLGLPGTLSSRLQPNHPTDDPQGVACLCYWGLSLAAGDALLGVNPAIDTVDNVERLLRLLDGVRRRVGVPSQICVLAHIKTQLACLERGAPVEVLFQSLAGTEATNLAEFDISVELLDHGYRTMAERGALRDVARQFMYFETGQGSEFTYGRHHGIDMTTTEALCYGLARVRPVHGQQRHGLHRPRDASRQLRDDVGQPAGPLHGQTDGAADGHGPVLHAAFTNNSRGPADRDAVADGCRRELLHGRLPQHRPHAGLLRHQRARRPDAARNPWSDTCARVFGMGRRPRDFAAQKPDGAVFRGPQWGNPEQFCESHQEFTELARRTPALYGRETAGPRPANSVMRLLKLNQGAARAAIQSELRIDELKRLANFRVLETTARDKETHLNSSDAGARLSPTSLAQLSPEHKQVQIIVSDGLSAEAVHHNLPDLLPTLWDGLTSRKVSLAQPIVVRYGRVKLAEQIADALECELVVFLVGERPGGDALASRSLSAYLVYRLSGAAQAEAARFSGNPLARWEQTVISNIYSAGLPPVEAGAVILEKVLQILAHKAAGNRLAALLE